MTDGEERDWYRIVADGTCPECGLTAAEVDRGELAAALTDQARLWQRLLITASVDALRHHSSPGRWSALEYACHVRGVLEVFVDRVRRALTEDDPEFDWWDHDGAVVEESYNDQDPTEVARGLVSAATTLDAALRPLGSTQWARAGTRRRSERFTVDELARFALHEAHHHRVDAEARLGESSDAAR